MAMATNEICDFCWDDEKREVPAISMEAGIPLCTRHLQIRRTQSRFAQHVQDERSILEEEITFPEPRLKRKPEPIISADQMRARQEASLAEKKAESLELFKPGSTEEEFTRGLGTLMRDVLDGKVEPEVAEAACKVADKVIRIMELRIKTRRDI